MRFAVIVMDFKELINEMMLIINDRIIIDNDQNKIIIVSSQLLDKEKYDFENRLTVPKYTYLDLMADKKKYEFANNVLSILFYHKKYDYHIYSDNRKFEIKFTTKTDFISACNLLNSF